MIALKGRTHAEDGLVQWIDDVRKTSGGFYVIKMRCDGVGELTSKDLKANCREKQVQHETSPPYMHEQNGKIEKTHRDISNEARAALIEARLPAYLWPHYIVTATYIHNHVPTESSGTFEAPIVKMFRAIGVAERPRVRHLRTYRCVAYVNIPE